MKTNYGTKLIASILGISIMFLGIYQVAFAYTYGNGVLSTPETLVAAATPTAAAVAPLQAAPKPVTTVKSASKNTAPTFTPKELAKYDGQNGHKAYIAVDGVVYDMTLLGSWKNGQHHGLSAGTDLSAAFSQSPHAKSILKLAKVVGTLVKEKAASAAPAVKSVAAPTWTMPTSKQYNGSNSNPKKTTDTATAKSKNHLDDDHDDAQEHDSDGDDD